MVQIVVYTIVAPAGVTTEYLYPGIGVDVNDVLANDVPAGTQDARIIDDSILPVDRLERIAWVDDSVNIVVDPDLIPVANVSTRVEDIAQIYNIKDTNLTDDVRGRLMSEYGL